MEDFMRKRDAELENSGRTEIQIQTGGKIFNRVGIEGYVQFSDYVFI